MIPSDHIDHNRRQLLGATAVAVAAAQLGMAGAAEAELRRTKLAQAAIMPGAHTSFASLKQINAGILNIGYAEAGAESGPPVILLHGWPYDIYSFVDVTPTDYGSVTTTDLTFPWFLVKTIACVFPFTFSFWKMRPMGWRFPVLSRTSVTSADDPRASGRHAPRLRHRHE